MKKVLLALMVGMLACAACENYSIDDVLVTGGQQAESVMLPCEDFIHPCKYIESLDTNLCCYIVNAEEQLPKVDREYYASSIPKYDFNTQSVVVASHYGCLFQPTQRLVETADAYILNIFIEYPKYDENIFFPVFSKEWIWGVYPKLKDKPIKTHFYVRTGSKGKWKEEKI